MELSEQYQIEIQNWLDENLEAEYVDSSFSHAFGTEVIGGYVANIENCPYSLDEIAYMVKDSEYCYSFAKDLNEWDSEIVNLYYNEDGYFEEL